MSLRNSRLSAEDVVDKRGTSSGGPKSTSKAQSPSQARLPLIAEKSPSAVGFDRLSSSFPILSACLWKNRWRTMTSVSSDVVPNQWSLISSFAAEYFFFMSERFQKCGNNGILTCSSDKKRVTLAMLLPRKSFNAIIWASLPKKMLFAKFCMIFAITMSPRRSVRLLSPFGTSISIISGVTTAGEMNLKLFRGLIIWKEKDSYRKNMKAPMAANLDSGHTPELQPKKMIKKTDVVVEIF